ncbi:MAG: carboxypeptidase-like regulatory domain-containing protein [Gemmatimonadaceae bacterium]
MASRSRWFLVPALIAAAAQPLVAQGTDTTQHAAAFKGSVASIRTTQPVPLADVRLMWIDSVHADPAHPGEPGELFVDTTRSRITISDSSGTFTVRNLEAGHYLINVRRIGFAPFEGMLTMNTHPVEMELALEQLMNILPPIRITESATNKVTERLDRVGFTERSRMGHAATFYARRDILDTHAQTLQQLLTLMGVSMSDTFLLDRFPMEWSDLVDYPMDLIVGVEVYRHSLPVEFSMTRRGRLTFSNDRGTPLTSRTVVLWTYLPGSQ